VVVRAEVATVADRADEMAVAAWEAAWEAGREEETVVVRAVVEAKAFVDSRP
jgi:hypothetical protein